MPRPERPDFRRQERPRSDTLGFVFRTAWLALIGGLVYYFLIKPQGGAVPSVAPTAVQQAADPIANQPKTGQPQPAAAPPAESAPGAVEATTTASIHKQQLAIGKFAQRQAIAAYDDLSRVFDAWEKEFRAWEQEGPPLMKSDDGKRIAGDGEQVKRFRGLFRIERPSSEHLDAAKASAEALITPIRDAANNPNDASAPEVGVTSTLQTLRNEATNARDSYRQARAAVKAMLAKVKATSPAAPADKTLEEAIAALDQEEATERVAAIDAAEKQAKDDGAKRVAKEKAQLAKQTADAEAARIANEAAKKKQAADLANARTVEEMKLKQKEADAQIAHLQDIAEQRRIGNLKAGTKWKGEYNAVGFTHRATFTITSRTKDDIRGEVAQSGNGGAGEFGFTGKVIGTRLKLNVTRGMANATLDLVYQPSTNTIAGSMLDRDERPVASINVRLVDEKDE